VSGDLDCADRFGTSIVLSGQGGNQITQAGDYFRDAWRAEGIRGYAGTVGRFLMRRPCQWQRVYFAMLLGDIRQAVLPYFLRRHRLRRADVLFQDPPAWLGPRGHAAWSTLREETESVRRREPVTGAWTTDSIWEEATSDPRHVWTLEGEDARATERGKELRYPFLSWSLLSLMMSIPWHSRPPDRLNRAFHREAMKGIVPDEARLRTTFVYFNQANMANYLGAGALIRQILDRRPWRAGEFVRRRSVSSLLSSRLSRAGEPFDFAACEDWRLLRDVAALEVWLEKISC
jgi:hypothetical protein